MDLKGKKIVVMGFGAQGSAQAKNLAGSGMDVTVYLRAGSSREKEVRDPKIKLTSDLFNAASIADLAVILLPDGEQPALFGEMEAHFKRHAAVVFAHGFNIRYGLITPRKDLDVILVAPMAHADMLRADFVSGKGTPCQIAVAQDASGNAEPIATEYAKAVALTGPFIRTTFAEETETDLFAEQAVLCGGLFALIRTAFETLVEKGYGPEIAYFCCLKEVKAIANLLYEEGIEGAREKISDTALYGDLTRGPRLINGHVRGEMRKILDEIRSGAFKEEIVADRKNGNALLRRLLKKDKDHEIDKVHRKFKGGGK